MFYQKKVLIIVDHQDCHLLKDISKNNENLFWDLHWIIVDYRRLNHYFNEIENHLNQHKIDFILFSQNDQINYRFPIGPIIRRLNIGYSSISGIDNEYRIEQMIQCYSDFINRNIPIKFNLPDFHQEKGETRGKFYLFFDVEQVACVRYGLPRLLSLLNMYHMKGNFFITNFIKEIYPDIVDILVENGHFVGIHGRWHENLARYNLADQSKAIESMILHLGTNISGANFIGRMDNNSNRALIENNIRYVVYPAINRYRWIAYPKIGCDVYSFNYLNKHLQFIPVNVETYGQSWFSIKNMIDSTLRVNESGTNKVSILMHPFRDGNLQYIDVTKNILEYLMKDKMLSSCLLSEYENTPNRIQEITELNQISGIQNQKRHNYFPLYAEDIKGFLPENFIKLCKLFSIGKEIYR
jgi:peptidoglycan/xylan/chitin deacetylase (PgdA/CDA1 family)